jgi:FkbM family methyltransferase
VLATVFDRVYTFEPERQNFACLVRNTDDLPGVFAARMALGLDRGCRDLFVHQTRTGRHALVDQPGPVPVLRIDDLRLDLCDAIVLDLEGSELAALQGARWTLQHHHPLLIVEENGRHEDYGIAAGAIAALLRTMGYDAGMRHEEDLIFDVARTYACH